MAGFVADDLWQGISGDEGKEKQFWYSFGYFMSCLEGKK